MCACVRARWRLGSAIQIQKDLACWLWTERTDISPCLQRSGSCAPGSGAGRLEAMSMSNQQEPIQKGDPGLKLDFTTGSE